MWAPASARKNRSNPPGAVRTSCALRRAARVAARGARRAARRPSLRADAVRLVADLEDVLPLEHVELVLVLVDVEGRVDERRHLLEQRERPAGRIGRDAEQDRHVAEDEALALVCRHREGHVRHDSSLTVLSRRFPAVP